MNLVCAIRNAVSNGRLRECRRFIFFVVLCHSFVHNFVALDFSKIIVTATKNGMVASAQRECRNKSLCIHLNMNSG